MSNIEAWLKSVKTKQLDVTKGVKTQKLGLSTSEAKQRIAAAKAYALSKFKKRFPNADISRFQVEAEVDTNSKATVTVLFTESDGSQTNPLIKDRKYWSQALMNALQLHQNEENRKSQSQLLTFPKKYSEALVMFLTKS